MQAAKCHTLKLWPYQMRGREIKTKEKAIIFFFSFRATPRAHGSSQARGRIRAAATGLHHRSWQCWILNPLNGATDWTHVLTDPHWVCFCRATTGTCCKGNHLNSILWEHLILLYDKIIYNIVPGERRGGQNEKISSLRKHWVIAVTSRSALLFKCDGYSVNSKFQTVDWSGL